MAKPADNCATILKVLADETRLAVVRQLMAGPQQVNEINGTLQLEQSLLSHHLRILRDAGISATAKRFSTAFRKRCLPAYSPANPSISAVASSHSSRAPEVISESASPGRWASMVFRRASSLSGLLR